MRVVCRPTLEEGEALSLALGAAGGITLGLLLARGFAAPRVSAGRVGQAIGEGARSVASRIRPARLRRMVHEQEELSTLEDRVLDRFLADRILSDRGIDVGAISPGIIELSGSVWTQQEADLAMRIAQGVAGVRTVVNRMEVEEETRHFEATRQWLEEEGSGLNSLQHSTSRVGGMGVRRQSPATEPDRKDDSSERSIRALESADYAQRDEEFGTPTSRSGPTPWRRRFKDSDIQPQDPHGRHARVTLDAPPEELNSYSRVGEGLKPADELALEQADLPLKPHSEREPLD